jgi:radical SAM superfamily enzyme YgiQ (UPF0313 family)
MGLHRKPRVLLIKCRSLSPVVNSWTPPLGVLYLTSYLRQQAKADVQVIDVVLKGNPRKAIVDAVREMAPDLVGLSALSCEAVMLHDVARIVRSVQPGVAVVAGGPYPSSDPTSVLSDWNVDVAVVGEGEQTVLELTRLVMDEGPAWRLSMSLASIQGIAVRGADGTPFLSPPRSPILDLDSLPLPAWDAIDLSWFWRHLSISTAGIRPYLPLFTSRGCPFQCIYCHQIFGKRFRCRSPEGVLEEISWLHRQFGIRDFEFLDDSININRQRFTSLLSGIQQLGIRPMLHFPNGVRTDLLEAEDIRLLHQVGAGEVSVAVETVSPRLQKLIGKNLDLEKVDRNIQLMARLRIFTRGFFMLGLPSETERELRDTIDYAVHCGLHLAFFHVTTPFPGTAVHDEFFRRGKLPEEVNAIDHDFAGSRFNGSDVPDGRFRWLFQQAYARFYSRPGRVLRILRDRPYPVGYGSNVIGLLKKVLPIPAKWGNLDPRI